MISFLVIFNLLACLWLQSDNLRSCLYGDNKFVAEPEYLLIQGKVWKEASTRFYRREEVVSSVLVWKHFSLYYCCITVSSLFKSAAWIPTSLFVFRKSLLRSFYITSQQTDDLFVLKFLPLVHSHWISSVTDILKHTSLREIKGKEIKKYSIWVCMEMLRL